MRIQIKDKSQNRSITIPNGLLLNGITARIAVSAAGKQAPEAIEKIPPHVMNKIFAELKRIRKKHGPWVLVEVSSASGEQIEITL